jgi:hypothetical protein
MKLWEKIIEYCLRGVTNITENQFGFMIERCKEQKKDMHMIFIDI